MPGKASAIFAQRLKEARNLRGVSQRALGALIGMTKKTGSVRINRYEQLASRPDIDTAQEIAKVLNLPLAYFFCENDQLAKIVLAHFIADEADRAELEKLADSIIGITLELNA